jgi:HAD superfamily hydrolase (TIGR01509 family)
MIKGIIFDLDGTLVDSLSVTFDAFNYSFAQCGGKKLTPAEIMAHFGTGEYEIFAKILGDSHAMTAYNACKSYMDSHLAEVPLHEGIGDLLELIKSEGVPISIVTGRSWDTTELILKHHRILDRFIRVVANDHVDLPKPSPEGLHLALSHMNLQPSEVLFIGDSPVDIMAARSAGSRGVAALWDLLANKDLLEPHQPHHWVNHPKEIWEVWKELKFTE